MSALSGCGVAWAAGGDFQNSSLTTSVVTMPCCFLSLLFLLPVEESLWYYCFVICDARDMFLI